MYDVGPRLHNDVGRPPMGPPRVPAAMNAPNPLMPQPRPLSESTLDQVRRAIQERRQSPSAGTATCVRRSRLSLRRRASAPSGRKKLIVTLKQMIDDLPGARSSSAEERRLREWIVTTCIHAYFDDA